ncbi:ATP-dependent nuclease [Brevibacterium permense]|uniref:ATP-dependent endonuclease n=1 Tax=Brevibacterium permense TaxID=234834 RepID=A0ABN2AVM0_9MICO|nr:ATP-dependent endonuclease [Brevibacterium permense]
MKIDKIRVSGYRLLDNFELELRDELSLIIGKNNTGKTSLLNILKSSLSGAQQYSFEDFSIATQKCLLSNILVDKPSLPETDLSITLTVEIRYDESDNLRNLSKLMVDLSPEARNVYLQFKTEITKAQFFRLYEEFYSNLSSIEAALDSPLDGLERKNEAQRFLEKSLNDYLTRSIISFDPEDSSNLADLTGELQTLRQVLNLEYVSARRSVENRDATRSGSASGRALSHLSSQYFTDRTGGNEASDAFLQLAAQAAVTDRRFTETYESVFEDVIQKVKKFGVLAGATEDIHIISTIQPTGLLRDSTTVKYGDQDTLLPEDHNGLGYLNLIAIIMEIEIRILRMRSKTDSGPADINLLVIEEPEAHTHPQLQYIFIRQIKDLLRENNETHSLQLQTVLTTHSSHITAESDFDDIKYFRRIGDHVEARNMTDLEAMYEKDPKQYHFLKQYLTLTRAELFFADKAVFIEGDTERILMRAMMQKIDMEDEDPSSPLSAQNISVVEVGAHSQIFDRFIEFTGLKALIITDIDSAKVEIGEDKKKHLISAPVDESTHTTNSAIRHFFRLSNVNDRDKGNIQSIRHRPRAEKQLSKRSGAWEISKKNPSLFVAYQGKEDGYEARSYEDAFIHINREFIQRHISDFRGLKNRRMFSEEGHSAYDLAENCIHKKTHFALDVIYAGVNSGEPDSTWRIPLYISEGLRWLRDV